MTPFIGITVHRKKPWEGSRSMHYAIRRSVNVVSLLAATVTGIVGLITLAPNAAQAEPPKLIFYGSFGAHVENADGIAVERSGDLFVSSLFGRGLEPSTVVKLDPAGSLLSPPSPFGSAYYSGVAVDPANGDVYALGQEGSLFAPGPSKIFVYDPDTGARVGTPFEVPAFHNWEGIVTDVQIASDSAGDVYVPVVSENEVLEYPPGGCESAPSPCPKVFTDSGTLKEPTGVAIAPSGDVWVADAGDNRIVELDSGGAPVEVNGRPVEIKSEGVSSVALDGHGDVFALIENGADPCGEKGVPCLHLVEYGAEGRQLADVGAGLFGFNHEGGVGGFQHFRSMVAANQASGRVYVQNEGTVWVYGPPTAPVVGRELTAEVGASEVKLGALVNPGGSQTTYRFEFGPTSAYGGVTPFPEGSVGEGTTARAVWAAASGLAAGATYHYRVVAINELGTAYGPDQTFTTLTAEQAACPNEQLRGGFSARLPDCRAYELVTPSVATGSQFDAAEEYRYASTVAKNGQAISLYAREPRPDAPSAAIEYVASRGASSWALEVVGPLESYDAIECAEHQYLYAYSDQLTREVMRAGAGTRANSYPSSVSDSCNPEGRQVASGEPVGYENLVVRENASGAYELVNIAPPGVTPADAQFEAASADLSHVIFTERSPLAEGARYGAENLYEWDEGTVRLVSWLPDRTAVTGSLAAELDTPEHEGVVSSDGSHVLFTYGGALYDRIDGQRTVQVDEDQGGLGTGGGGALQAATPDGSKVFFLDESKLTAGSSAAAGEPDLYECVLPEGASKCELSDLTVAAGAEHADVLSVWPLGRHDSSYVYFVADGVLASNTREFTNDEGKTVIEGAQAGQPNLYLWNGERTIFIATGASYSSKRVGVGQTSPDGKWLAFESQKSLTGDPATLGIFLYSAATGQLACASCNPSGEQSAGATMQLLETVEEIDHGVVRTRHLLTDAGQMFFESPDALVPQDTNGTEDVYEYESGHVYLISSGTSSSGTDLEGVSESGDDVFLRSNQQLVPQDNQEGQLVIYDARVDGGLPGSASPPACTTADACRAPVATQPAIYGAPSSETFEGPGNLAPPATATVRAKIKTKQKAKCRRGLVKRKGRCVKAGRAKQAAKGGHKKGRR